MSLNIVKEARRLKLLLHIFLQPDLLNQGNYLICKTISHTDKLISSITVKWDEIEYFFFIRKVNSRALGRVGEMVSYYPKDILAPVRTS